MPQKRLKKKSNKARTCYNMNSEKEDEILSGKEITLKLLQS